MKITIEIEIPDLGPELKERRIAIGMSQTDAASSVGMSAVNLYRLESEKVVSAPYETVKKLADKLGMDIGGRVRAAIDEVTGG